MAKKGDSKDKIVRAALDCFIKNGVTSTSFRDIAVAAKVHQPLLGYYFKSFNEIFMSVILVLLEDLKGESLKAIAAQPQDPYLALLDYAEIPLKWATEKPQFTPIWTHFYHLASYDPQFRALNDAIRRVGRERITLLIFQIQEKRGLKLREGWTVSDLSYVIHAQITGDMVMAVTEVQNLERAKRLCRKGVEIALRGAFQD